MRFQSETKFLGCSVYSVCIFLQDSSVLHVEILDINDNTPEFVPSPSASLSTYIRHINEGPESVDSVIIDVNATDKDTGTNAKILYSMSGDEYGHFQLNSTTVSLTFLIHAVINFWSRHSSFSTLHPFFSWNRVNYNS